MVLAVDRLVTDLEHIINVYKKENGDSMHIDYSFQYSFNVTVVTNMELSSYKGM